MSIKGFIFDFDGTLGDTFPLIFVAFRTAFRPYLQRELTDHEISRHFGPTEAGVCQEVVPEHWSTSYQIYLDEYEKHHQELAVLYPGMEQALAMLKARGIKLGIVSGKGPDSMGISLRHFGVTSYFDSIETGSDRGADKPPALRKILKEWGMEPEDAVYLGDAAYDIRVSRELGMHPFGAAWAKVAEVKKMEEYHPEKLFFQVADLTEWIATELKNG